MDTETACQTRRPERWLMLALMWFVYFCFGLVTVSLAPLVTPIMRDLALSDKQMGFILGTWQLVYIGTAYPLGSLVDRIGLRRSVTIGTAVMALSLVARAASTGFYSLLLSVALFGFGGPIISASAPKLVSLWFDDRERGLASGIYSVAPVSGNTAALAIGGSLIIPYTGSWRGIGLVYGVVLVAALLAWLSLAKPADADRAHGAEGAGRSKDSHQRRAAAESGAKVDRGMSGWQVLRHLVSLRNVQLILLLALGSLFISHGLGNWLPTFLHERGMTLAEAGLWSAASTAIGVVGGLFIPGLARPARRPHTLAVVFGVTAVALLGMALVGGPVLVVSVLVVGLVMRAMMPLAHVLLMETPGVGSARMGAATGMYFTVGEIGGFGGPFLLGVIRDTTGSLQSGLLLLGGFAALIALVPLFVKTRPTIAATGDTPAASSESGDGRGTGGVVR